MKRILYFLMALVMVAGCSQYEYELSNPGLTVKESLLNFTAKGGEGFILVESDVPVKAVSNSVWCQVKVTGKKIEVKVESYSGIESRTAMVSLSNGDGFTVNVAVTQSATRFIIEKLSFNAGHLETTLKTAVISDNKVTVSSPYIWIIPKYERDSIFIAVFRNDDWEMRTGIVEVTSNKITQTITIRQRGEFLY